MKIVVLFDEGTGKFSVQADASSFLAIGMLEVAIHALVKRGSQEGGLRDLARKVDFVKP